MSNPAMPGLVKIGESNNIPRRLKKEANKSDTWKPPYPYKLEFVLNTLNHKEKEKDIHTFLERQCKRVLEGMNREFFLATPAEVLPLFQLIDGEFIDGESFLLQHQDQQSNDSEDDSADEISVSDVTESEPVQEIRDCFDSDDHGPPPLLNRYDHSRDTTRAEFESFDDDRKKAFKTWRRDKQGISKNEYKVIYRREMNGSPALRWDMDHLSYVLRENYPWAQKLRGIVTEDCFPDYYVSS